MERQVIADLCAGERQVIASGGGAFVSEQNREVMLSGGRVFFLSASPAVILRRVQEEDAGGPIRPLLAVEDPEARIAELLAQRMPAYTQAHHTVETDALTAEGVAVEIGGICKEIDARIGYTMLGINTPASRMNGLAYRVLNATELDSYDFSEHMTEPPRGTWLSIRKRREESNPQSFQGFLERLR